MCIPLGLRGNVAACVLVLDSVCAFECEAGSGSLKVPVFFGNMCIYERMLCVCVCK